jgi:hypothetical protein
MLRPQRGGQVIQTWCEGGPWWHAAGVQYQLQQGQGHGWKAGHALPDLASRRDLVARSS